MPSLENLMRDKLDLKVLTGKPLTVHHQEAIPKARKTPWNAEKSAKLAEFMKTWGEKMGQPNYQKASLAVMWTR